MVVFKHFALPACCFYGYLHTGMITHHIQKSLLVPKLVSSGAQNQHSREGYKKKKTSMLSYLSYIFCLQQLMAQDSPSQSWCLVAGTLYRSPQGIFTFMFFCNTFVDCKKQSVSGSFPEELCGILGTTVLGLAERTAFFFNPSSLRRVFIKDIRLTRYWKQTKSPQKIQASNVKRRFRLLWPWKDYGFNFGLNRLESSSK